MKEHGNWKNDVKFFFKQGKKHFPEFVQNHLANYLDEILLFEGQIGSIINSNYEKITSLCESINEAIKYYYLGNTINSYKKLEKALVEKVKQITIK